MYTELIMVILGVSLILYTLLGGADFGAGIIELFVGDRANSTVSRAMAPVWEANHMWLIIAIVILFNGFPKAYTVLSTNLHIPVLLFLVAIILRGTAFTFRHYDAFKDESQKLYSGIFRYSSFFAVLFLGITVGAFFGGTFLPDTSAGFLDQYIFPWFNWFCLSVGIFIVAISAYIAAIFLLGEVKTDEGYLLLRKFVSRLFVVSAIAGIAIFLISFFEGLVFHEYFINHPLSIACVVLASLLIPWIFRLMHQRKVWTLRFVVGTQIMFILLGWFIIQWPNLVIFKDGSTLSMYEAAGPEATMFILFMALAIGVVIIFPGLYYLSKIFKSEKEELKIREN